MFIMQSAHAQKIAKHMNENYGDFGRFTSQFGKVTFIPIADISSYGHLATEIKMYAFGYNAALNETAAPELLEALKGLINISTHPQATKAEIKRIAQEARAAIQKAEG